MKLDLRHERWGNERGVGADEFGAIDHSRL
jgi:hypothetical protein